MIIPWATALQVAKKLLPVVIHNAPDLLKTFERYRTASPAPNPPPVMPAVAALQEQIEAHQRTIALQADTIVQLEATLSVTKRSLTIARAITAVTTLLFIAIVLFLVLRF